MPYYAGDTITLDVELFDASNEPADPVTLTLYVRDPANALQTYTYPPASTVIARDGVGIFTGTIVLAVPGQWVYEWRSTGPAPLAGAPTTIDVLPALPDQAFAAFWRPTVADVAALLAQRAGRAIDDDTPVNSFTDEIAERVEQYIDMAVRDVSSRVGVPIPMGQQALARDIAAMWASVLFELSQVPGGSADSDRSAAPAYQGAYLARLQELKDACPRLNMRLV